MNRDEEIAAQYLSHIGFKTIQYEPDGNVPPDFLCDSRVAVEVRRLNQTFDTGKGAKGLEEVNIPLRERFCELLLTLGPPNRGQCWFVFYSFRRPVPKWKVLKSQLELALKAFMALENPAEVVFELADKIEIHIFPSSHKFDSNCSRSGLRWKPASNCLGAGSPSGAVGSNLNQRMGDYAP